MVRFPVMCPGLDDPPGGIVDVKEPQPVGAKAQYICTNGQMDTCNIQRFCLSGGIWSGYDDVCTQGMLDINSSRDKVCVRQDYANHL